MYHKKKHVNFSESLLLRLDVGINKIKSRLLGHQVITEDMIFQDKSSKKVSATCPNMAGNVDKYLLKIAGDL